MTDYTKPYPCGYCGKMVTVNETHTYEHCLRWKEYLKTQARKRGA